MVCRLGLDGGSSVVDGLPSQLFTQRPEYRIRSAALPDLVCRHGSMQRVGCATGRIISTCRTDSLHRRARGSAHGGHGGALRRVGARERRQMRWGLVGLRREGWPVRRVGRLRANHIGLGIRRDLALAGLRRLTARGRDGAAVDTARPG